MGILPPVMRMFSMRVLALLVALSVVVGGGCGFSDEDAMNTLSDEDRVDLCFEFTPVGERACVILGETRMTFFRDRSTCEIRLSSCGATVREFRACMAESECDRLTVSACDAVRPCFE
jgi:hypothetical protein